MKRRACRVGCLCVMVEVEVGAVYIEMQTRVWKCKWGLRMGRTGREKSFRGAGGGGFGLKMILRRERKNEQCYDQSAIRTVG